MDFNDVRKISERVKFAEKALVSGNETELKSVLTELKEIEAVLDIELNKPKRAEPLKFKRPIPVVGRMRTPPYPFIRPKPKLLAMPNEEEREALELARQTVIRIMEKKLKREIAQAKADIGGK